MNDQPQTDLDKAAAEEGRGGLVGDLWGFMKQNKKWWLLPVLIMLLILGILTFLSATGLAPFIYTLF